MDRLRLVTYLLLAGAARGSDCRIATGPNGFCAAIHLEPGRVELPVGSSLQIAITGLDCRDGSDCFDCTHRRRVRWQSTAPAVASVDSTGFVRAHHMGVADIRLESDGSAPHLLASMHVTVPR